MSTVSTGPAWAQPVYFHSLLPPDSSKRCLQWPPPGTFCARRKGHRYLLKPALACLFPYQPSSASSLGSPFKQVSECHKVKPKVVMMMTDDDNDDGDDASHLRSTSWFQESSCLPLLVPTTPLRGRQGKNFSLPPSLSPPPPHRWGRVDEETEDVSSQGPPQNSDQTQLVNGRATTQNPVHLPLSSVLCTQLFFLFLFDSLLMILFPSFPLPSGLAVPEQEWPAQVWRTFRTLVASTLQGT